MINYFLHLKPLMGHIDPALNLKHPGTTGTFLSNIFEGNPEEITHPRMIRRYLESKNRKPSDDFAEYRLSMLSLINELPAKK